MLRVGGPADAAPLADLLRALSPASGFHRFLSGVGEPRPGLLRALLATDDTRGAWLADAGGLVVGHAGWSVDRGTADVGIVVADAWQGFGLGRRLFTAAVLSAAAAGGTRLHLDVHPDNRRVVAMLRARTPHGALHYTDGLVQADLPVAAVLAPGFAPTPVPDPSGDRDQRSLSTTSSTPITSMPIPQTRLSSRAAPGRARRTARAKVPSRP